MQVRLALLALSVVLTTLSSPALAETATTIMMGLNSPRGLAIGPDGSVYVAEAGNGGATEVTVGSEAFFLGNSGRISRYRKGVQEEVVTGLPSLIGPHGVMGPTNVEMTGNGVGYATIGLGGDPALNESFPAGLRSFATLVRFTAQGKWGLAAELGGYESTANPDGGAIDSNPYGITTHNGKLFVTDAGGNSLLKVGSNGGISTVAVFPKREIELFGGPFFMDAVPTAVAGGPDGALYVSQLTGFPFPAGGANVYRVAPGSAPTVYADGFTTLIDLEFDAAGNLYVLQYPVPGFSLATGDLIKVGTNGDRTTVLSGLVDTTGFALGRSGEIYLSSGAFSDGTGVVTKVVL
ncbi:MAG TPA: ScyD/ScyE family protein [Fimbriimonas sp.]